MALNGNALGDAMKAAVDALTDVQKQNRTTVFEAMGTAIVNYIKANAVVSGSVTVASVSGVTAGGGVSGPGTGTMSAGTIT